MTIPKLNDIYIASDRIRPYIHNTPVMTSAIINDIFKASLYFKCENFQKAGAFKSRGAINAVMSLSDDEIKSGVATHSSGNHAAALSRAASIRKCKAYIVMPDNTSKIKCDAVRQYGGEIIFCAPNLRAREETLQKTVDFTGAEIIHPYNDYRIIAGQGTAALEIFEKIDNLDIIMTPVGGGGLLSGTSLSTKYLSHSTQVIAAEPSNADDAYRSFVSRTFQPSVNPNTIADGLLTSLGTLTFPIILEHVDEIITASEESIIEAMRLIWTRMKIIIEPSSAVPVAALLEGKKDIKGCRVAIILSGGNADIDNLPWFTKP